MIKSIESHKEVPTKDLFSSNKYSLLNREEKWDKAIQDGWKYNILTGCWKKGGIDQ